MKKHVSTIAMVALLTVVGGSASAQETSRTRARATLPTAVFEQIDAMARGAEQQGIPGDLLYNKALEGAAKHVPAGRLAPAVQAYTDRLVMAKDAFGSDARGPLLVAGADALQRGVSADLLRGLGRSQERSPMAVLALADLVETGIPSGEALSLVREAMQRRARDQQMLDMSGEVRRLMRQGQTAQDAIQQVRRGLRQGRGGGVTPPVAPASEPMGRQRGGGG